MTKKICRTEGHHYALTGSEAGGYYKHDDANTNNMDTAYKMLFCIRCGDTKEITHMNHLLPGDTISAN